ncbi:hypothetical protein MKS88_005578 [Plasmodium brasilianum]|uniref:Uncharacterized protein n=2 Tax=Plasmodium (Plasmodium) TaxID=418103 RepID=A0A1A8WD25_PLAMA|nr:conserved Plasmodium protein, unknown function [Plasmodium malariae]KAI4834899.1 hypothetical protein MKS88_005578 [Plasmodium brasilianum]SBS90767.1 hypothetical protein PMALA_030830 [Plasmodium malariae]SCP03466.1 conserved Plasmodium protein, unknown function [Plasmodium malariae]
MYKDTENKGVEKKQEEQNEKIIIRIKRKIDDTTIPSIYVKKSNKKVCNGLFYKHIDTVIPEIDVNKKNVECINIFLKHEQFNCSNSSSDLSFLEKKRKFHSMRGCEKDLRETINNLKKYKIINQNIQYVDLDNKEKKGKYKIIDIDLLHEKDNNDNNNNINSINEFNEERNEDEKEEKQHNKTDKENYEYDLYIIDDQRLNINDHIDYLYDIKNSNIDTSEVIVLEDVYENNTNEYETNSFSSSSSDRDTKKEMSDYPDESWSSANDHSACIGDDDIMSSYSYNINSNSDYYDNNENGECYEENMRRDGYIENISSDCYDQNLPSDCYDENIPSDCYDERMHNNLCDSNLCNKFNQHSEADSLGENIQIVDKVNKKAFDKNKENYFINFESYVKQKNSLNNNKNKYKNNEKKKSAKKKYMRNQKINSLIFEEKIKDELEKRLKKKNEDLLNATLSDKLKILEQMENEYYDN